MAKKPNLMHLKRMQTTIEQFLKEAEEKELVLSDYNEFLNYNEHMLDKFSQELIKFYGEKVKLDGMD